MKNPQGRRGEFSLPAAPNHKVEFLAGERRMRGGGRQHGDPFPLPVPSVGGRSDRLLPQNYKANPKGVYSSRARVHRIAECVRSLNSLAGSTARSVRLGGGIPGTPSSQLPVTAVQQSVLDRVGRRIDGYGKCPAGMDPCSSFYELLKSDDMYSLERKNLAPYEPELLKIAKSDILPKAAVSLLPAHTAQFLENPEKFIIRSDKEIAEWTSENPSFKPYWDPALAASKPPRLELYMKLKAKGLISFRKKIKAQAGLFFVWKSSKKGIRLIVDARQANACHRRPPKTKLGGAAALAELPGSS
jgi:hypothetical protein